MGCILLGMLISLYKLSSVLPTVLEHLQLYGTCLVLLGAPAVCKIRDNTIKNHTKHKNT